MDCNNEIMVTFPIVGNVSGKQAYNRNSFPMQCKVTDNVVYAYNNNAKETHPDHLSILK